MSDSSARCGSGQRGAASVGEKIQDFERPAGFLRLRLLYYRRKPIPVDGLLRKKSRVFEAERLQAEGQILVTDAPLIRQIKKFPFAPAFLAAVIVAVFLFPAFLCLRRVPNDLRIGPY